VKAHQIFQILLNEAIGTWQNTCDGRVAGDANKEVKKAATCFKLTAELLQKSIESHIDMIITHEPTFLTGDTPDLKNRIDLKKQELLEKSGIALYRFHDHAHYTQPDYIHAGFIQTLDLKIKKEFPKESLGVGIYELNESLTTHQLALRIKEKLNVEFIRIVGKDDYILKTICLGLGIVDQTQINRLFEPGCDLFITGEVEEVCVDEYIRDACFFGENKSVLVLGHYSSEYSGMQLLADKLNKTVLPTVFLKGSEVYHGI